MRCYGLGCSASFRTGAYALAMRSERHVRVVVVGRYSAHVGGANSTIFSMIGLHELSTASMTPDMRACVYSVSAR